MISWKQVEDITSAGITYAEHHFNSGAIRMVRVMVYSDAQGAERIKISGKFAAGDWHRAKNPERCTLEWAKKHVEKEFRRWIRRAQLKEDPDVEVSCGPERPNL